MLLDLCLFPEFASTGDGDGDELLGVLLDDELPELHTKILGPRDASIRLLDGLVVGEGDEDVGTVTVEFPLSDEVVSLLPTEGLCPLDALPAAMALELVDEELALQFPVKEMLYCPAVVKDSNVGLRLCLKLSYSVSFSSKTPVVVILMFLLSQTNPNHKIISPNQ